MIFEGVHLLNHRIRVANLHFFSGHGPRSLRNLPSLHSYSSFPASGLPHPFLWLLLEERPSLA